MFFNISHYALSYLSMVLSLLASQVIPRNLALQTDVGVQCNLAELPVLKLQPTEVETAPPAAATYGDHDVILLSDDAPSSPPEMAAPMDEDDGNDE